jgi:alkylation response protein AidB-like acyl-CoA dehydrogenase
MPSDISHLRRRIPDRIAAGLAPKGRRFPSGNAGGVAVPLHGACDMRPVSTVKRPYHMIRALRIYERTSDVQRAVIARAILAAHQGG